MRKIFLTSGLVVCMACPAFADLGPNNKVLDANEQETTTSASCQEPTLEGYSGTSTFTAKWTPNPYKITYYPGKAKTALFSHDVAGTATEQNVTYAASVTIKDNTAADLTGGAWSQTGYTFDGWRSDHEIISNASTPALTNDNTEGGAARYTGGATHYNGTALEYNVPGDTQMYAIWAPNKSGKITLDSSVYPNNTTTSTAKYTTSTGVTAVNPNEVFSIYETGLYDYANLSTLTPVNSFTSPSKDGYTFEGFYESDGNTRVINNDGSIINETALRSVSSVNGTATWYAHWTPNTYTVTYHPGTAKSGSASHAVSGTNKTTNATFDENYTVIGNSGGTTDTNYSQTGYTFDGWLANYTIESGTASALTNDNTEGGTSYSAGDGETYKVVGNVDLYAQWKAKQYDVTYDKGAHSASNNYTDTNGITFDTTYTTLAQATTNITADAGYTFCGWSQSSSDSCTSNTLINAGSAMSAPWTTDDDLTLYAIYKADNFTITYNCGTQPGTQPLTGSVPAQQPVTQDGTYNIAANTCIYQGWHFTGWKCDYDLTQANVMPLNGVTYQPGNTGTFKSAHNVTCTAQWAANEITTTFVGNGGTVTGGGQSCTYEGTISLPSAVTRTGYTFDGWTVTNTPASN